MHLSAVRRRLASTIVALAVALSAAAPAASQELDRSRYIPPDELRPGMKGFGRTVMRGTEIQTFDLEVISVMRNAYFPKRDIILIRCSGLNLEHSGIIGGMSGSPCYIPDESGKPRMFGAVALGWTFNKDPICGVTAITDMLEVAQVRSPDSKARAQADAGSRRVETKRSATGPGLWIEDLTGRVPARLLHAHSRFSVFRATDGDRQAPTSRLKDVTGLPAGLRKLEIPLMVTGGTPETMAKLREQFEPLGLTPVAGGGPASAAGVDADQVKLEPGSVICVPFVTGDLRLEALGTCTEITDQGVLGFGHNLFGNGSVELPLATGFIHTVIPSVIRSNKLGGALQTVGTLRGDETAAIYGVRGEAPKTIPLEVVIRNVNREETYQFEILYEEYMTAGLMSTCVLESIYAHSLPPEEYAYRYAIETEFEDIGTFRTRNFASQAGFYGVAADLGVPVSSLLRAPFAERTRPVRARLELTITEGSRLARIDEISVPRTAYKPGEKVEIQVRFEHYRREEQYSFADYQIQLPDDLPDGTYELSVESAIGHLQALRMARPHLFRVDSLEEALATFNLAASFPENRVYVRLELPTGGVAVRRLEMPELPSFRQKLLADARRADVQPFADFQAEQFETDDAIMGSESVQIRVSRRADQ